MALLSILRFSELSNQHMLNAGKGDIHSEILLLNKHAVSSLCTVCFHFDFFGEYILFLKVLDHRDFAVCFSIVLIWTLVVQSQVSRYIYLYVFTLKRIVAVISMEVIFCYVKCDLWAILEGCFNLNLYEINPESWMTYVH